MKLKQIVALVLTGVILVTGTCAPSSSVQAAAKWPSGPAKNSLSSDSAIVMELSTGTILYQKNCHKKHYPASITKIMTSMLVAENTALSDTVTVSERAAYGIESGSSTIYSDPGEKLSVEQCLYAIMLESANEVCLAVGEHISGSSKKFVELMNRRVKELGLKDTHFQNPNGLPDPKHYTTAYDMAVIARQAMKSSAFRKVCGTKSYVCDKTNTHKMKRVWNNHHQMISGWKYPKYEYKYAIGGKTGYTHAARNTLVTYAEKDGMELVCVIMKADGPTQGEPNEYTDSTKLLNFGFEKYRKYTINQDNTEINADLFNNYGSYFNAEESPVRLAEDSTVILPKGIAISQAKQSITYYPDVSIKEGDTVIGKITYTYNNRTVGSSDIIYTSSGVSDAHLDEASRNMVNSKIHTIENSNAKNKHKKKLFSSFRNGFRSISKKVGKIFHNQLAGSVIIIVIALLLILLIGLSLHSLTPSSRRKRRRRKRRGGYQSRGGKRHHAKQMRHNKDSLLGKRNGRRNHSKHYEKNHVRKEPKKRTKKGVNYHKRHKNTKESFGKNFFDF